MLFAGLSDKLVGPLVYGFSADPVAAAKVLSSFAKDHDKLVVKAGAREIVAPRVHVALGQQTTVKIVLKGDQLVLE